MKEMKEVWRRFVTVVLAVLMAVTLVPVSGLAGVTAFAATSGTVAGLGDSEIGLSYSGTATDAWSASGTFIMGSVTSVTGTCGTDHYNSTLTITNKKSTKATLQFSYAVTKNGGTVQIDSTDADSSGSYTKELDPNASTTIYIKSNENKAYTTTIQISGIQLITDQQVKTTFKPAENGSYTINGTKVETDQEMTNSSLTAYSLVATPDDGYQFLGWYNETSGKYLSTNATASLYITADSVVTAKFAPSTAAIFDAGGQAFADLGEAVQYAQANKVTKITLTNSGSISGSYTIPAGITLLIPFDAAGTLYAATPKVLDSGSTTSAKNEYRRLTLAQGTSLTVDGAISVGGQYRSAIGSDSGRMSGAYGQVQLEQGSSINIENGGNLYAWGFVSGPGTVTAQSGAAVYEWFQIADFRGGSATMGMSNQVFPFSQYFIQNIESALTLEAGAKENVYTGIYASRRTFGTAIALIGDDGMFKIDSGSLTKSYDGSTDRTIYDINGTAELNSLKLSLMGISVDSSSYVLPITNNMSINIASGGKLTVNQSASLLPGVEVNIAENGDLDVASGKSLYVYDGDDWGNYSITKKFYPVAYAPSKTYNRTDADLADARITVDGSLTAEGSIYTTDKGAAICSSGAGQYVQSGTPGTETVTHQYTQSYSSVTDHQIAITPAKLLNADGTYTETASAKAGDTISYVSGTWGGTQVSYTVTWLDEDGTVLETDTDVKAGTTPAYDGATPTKAADAQYTYTFSGWTPDVSAVTGDISYKAVYTRTTNQYTVTWKDEDGTVLKTEKLDYGATPSYSGDTPTKEGDAEHSYTFAGWKAIAEDGTQSDITTVTADATYTATYTESVNSYTVTWQNDDGTQLQKEENVPYGATPEYTGETPTKAADAQYTYTFIGWTPAVDAITGDTTYTATYQADVNKYKVTWENEDGTEIKTEEVEYGTMPAYSGETPTKEGDAQYSYTFSGWKAVAEDGTKTDIAEVTGDVTYVAQFDQDVNKYTITWVNADGTELESDELEYGETPSYTGATPTKASDANFSYTFSGWSPDLAEVTGNASYTAQFTRASLYTYKVTFDANGGTGEMDAQSFASGVDASLNANAFTRENYSFAGWNTSADGTGTAYADQAAVGATLSGDLTLYAQWKLENGWLTDSRGKTYYQDGEIAYHSSWATIDSNKYYFDQDGYVVTGIYSIVPEGGSEEARCVFDSEGVFQEGQSGVYTTGDDTYWLDSGIIEEYPGLKQVTRDGQTLYYYFGSDGKAVKDGNYKVEKNNGLRLPCYQYKFDKDGIIEHDADTSKNGICDGDGSKFYYIDGIKVGEGLLKINGSYYYARTSTGEIIRGRKYWVTKTNNLGISEGEYEFDSDGKLILDGFVQVGKYTYYYEKGTLKKGFTKIGDDYYLFNSSSGMMYHDGTFWVPDNSYGLPGGMYQFGSDGKLQLRNGFATETHKDGKTYTYYYKDNVKVKGFTKIGDDYYMFNRSSGMMYTNATMWVAGENEYGIAGGMYYFGADGKMQK